MNLKAQLREELKAAMKSGDSLRKRVVRMALAEVKNVEVDKGDELEDPEVLGVLQKGVKARRETIEGAKKAKRPDLIEEAEAEIAILQEFLPQELSAEELRELVEETIAQVGATSMREMGKVMGALVPKIKGRADGRVANELVRELLG
ncbi:MAG: GatB/YqeY domain-containing protein [Chloroflexota bacterium]|nr:MAG: GatB/YqeY domain-containing protein [Chloroflexota bacterium]